jgi:hypothetical protein
MPMMERGGKQSDGSLPSMGVIPMIDGINKVVLPRKA